MKMTLWERLEKYGHIYNLKRKDDPRNFEVYLEDGLIRINCKKGVEMKVTIDTFLHLFMNNLPCDYPQWKGEKTNG